MNEMGNFCNGECDRLKLNFNDDLALLDDDEDLHNPDIPYYPGNKNLNHHTISPSAIHYNNYT